MEEHHLKLAMEALMSKASGCMVIDHTGCLHEGIANGGTYKFKTALF